MKTGESIFWVCMGAAMGGTAIAVILLAADKSVRTPSNSHAKAKEVTCLSVWADWEPSLMKTPSGKLVCMVKVNGKDMPAANVRVSP